MLKHFKKALRASQTDAENKLWYYLRSRRFAGFKFRRQHVLNGYIVDFVCLEERLIIELDGGQHADQIGYDLARTQKLEANGFRVLRFWNNEIFENIQGVLDLIYKVITPHPPTALCASSTSPTRGEVNIALTSMPTTGEVK